MLTKSVTNQRFSVTLQRDHSFILMFHDRGEIPRLLPVVATFVLEDACVRTSFGLNEYEQIPKKS